MPTSNPAISVVVIGRNEGERLVRCLASVRQMTGVRVVDVIYVDSGSSDNSVEMASREGARVILLPPGRTTAAMGRNAGWRSAIGEFVLFLDGDTIVDSEFVVRALPSLLDAKVAGLSGSRRESAPEKSVYNRVLDLDWLAPAGETAYFGGDALVRRSALEAVGGYNETLIAGEEPEMCHRMRKLGYRLLRVDLNMTLHDLNITRASQYWRRAVRTGFAYASISSQFRDTALPLWAAESNHNLRNAAFWCGTAALAAVCSLFMMSLLPVFGWVLLLLAFAARTAWQQRSKPASARTLFLYGLHSHLQQLPIAVGQLQFFWGGNRDRGLIEYKQVQG